MNLTYREAKKKLQAAIKSRVFSRIKEDVAEVVSKITDADVDKFIEEINTSAEPRDNPFLLDKGPWKATSKISEVWHMLGVVCFLNEAKTERAKALRAKVTSMTWDLNVAVDLSIISNLTALTHLHITGSRWQRTVPELTNGENLPASLKSIKADAHGITAPDVLVSSTLERVSIKRIGQHLRGIGDWTALKRLSVHEMSVADQEFPVFGPHLEELIVTSATNKTIPKIDFATLTALRKMRLSGVYPHDVTISQHPSLVDVYIAGGAGSQKTHIEDCKQLAQVMLQNTTGDIAVSNCSSLQSLRLDRMSATSVALQKLRSLTDLQIQMSTETSYHIPLLPSIQNVDLSLRGAGVTMAKQPSVQNVILDSQEHARIQIPTCVNLTALKICQGWGGTSQNTLTVTLDSQPALKSIEMGSSKAIDLTVGQCPKLTSLTARKPYQSPSSDYLAACGMTFATELPALSALSLIGGTHDFGTWKFPKLKTLSLYGAQNETAAGLSLPKLTELIVADCTRLKDIRAITACPKLKSLRVDSKSPVSPKPAKVSLSGAALDKYKEKLKKPPRKKSVQKAKPHTDKSLFLTLKRAIKAMSAEALKEALDLISQHATPALWTSLDLPEQGTWYSSKNPNYAGYSELNLYDANRYRNEVYLFVKSKGNPKSVSFRNSRVFGTYAAKYEHQAFASLAMIELLALAPAEAKKAIQLRNSIVGINLTQFIDDKVPELSSFEGLRSLIVSSATPIDLSSLQNCSQLLALGMSKSNWVQDLTSMAGLSIQRLYLADVSALRSLDSLSTLKNLRILELDNSMGHYFEEAVENYIGTGRAQFTKYSYTTTLNTMEFNLDPLRSCTELEIVKVTGLVGLNDVSGIANLDKLRNFILDGCPGVTSLPDLRKLTALRFMTLNLTSIKNGQNIANLPLLELLQITGAWRLENFAGMGNLPKLGKIRARGLRALQSLSGLTDLPELTDVNIEASSLETLEHLGTLPSLQQLEVTSTKLKKVGFTVSLPVLSSLRFRTKAAAQGIDVTGIEQAPKLTTFECPFPLVAGVQKLEELILLKTMTILVSQNIDMSDLFFPSLQSLDVGWSSGELELGWLAGSPMLTSVTLRGEGARSLWPLAALPNLERVNVAAFKSIADVMVFTHLEKLNYVSASGHNITKIRKVVPSSVRVW